jgi:hypothetical protein
VLICCISFVCACLLHPSVVLIQMVATDKKRNSTREAMTALRKRHGDPKVWLHQSSNSFERSSSEAAVSRLQAGGLQALQQQLLTRVAIWSAACCCAYHDASA